MRKPVALILTDTHLHKDNIDLVTDIFSQAKTLCEKLDIEYMIHAGDFFTSRTAQPLDVLLAGKQIIESINSDSLKLLIIPGNHDKTDQNSENSYLDVYSNICHVIRRSTTWHLSNLTVYFIPYFKENESYIPQFETINPSKKGILITHIAVTGVKNNDGSEVGNIIAPSLFNKFDKVFVGHYHNQSQVGNNIYYIGSAYQANFGEDDQKGFTILYSDGSHELVKSKFPEYVKLKVDISDTKKIKQIQKEHANSSDHVRIVFTGDETQLASLNKEKFNNIGIDVKFEKEVVRQDLSAVLENNVNFNRSNIKEAFEQFCVLNDYQDKEIGIFYLEKI